MILYVADAQLDDAWAASSGHNDARAVICEAGFQLLREKGVHGVTMRELARRIGISAMTPYRYFAHKDALLRQMRDLVGARFATLLRAAADPLAGPADRLHATGLAYVAFALDNEAEYRLFFDTPIAIVTESDISLPVQGPIWRHLVGMLQGYRPNATAPRLAEAAQFIWASVHGLAMLHLAGRIDIGRPLEQVMSSHIDGILAYARHVLE